MMVDAAGFGPAFQSVANNEKSKKKRSNVKFLIVSDVLPLYDASGYAYLRRRAYEFRSNSHLSR